MRRRFQGLSLEEQRKRQTMGRGRNKFVSKRRSSGLDTKSSTQLPTSSRARVIRANPFGLQVVAMLLLYMDDLYTLILVLLVRSVRGLCQHNFEHNRYAEASSKMPT